MDSFDLLALECIMPVLFNGCNWSNSSSPVWISILEQKTWKGTRVYTTRPSPVGKNDQSFERCLFACALGNYEIAELLMRSAERMSIRLDQYVNREGNSLVRFLRSRRRPPLSRCIRLFSSGARAQIRPYRVCECNHSSRLGRILRYSTPSVDLRSVCHNDGSTVDE